MHRQPRAIPRPGGRAGYLGLGAVVRRAHPQTGVDLTYVERALESVADAGDKYIGLDRFGRVVDQRWADASTGTATDRFQYGYDRDSQRTYRENLVDATFSELYSYDGLGQLSSFDRGTLNGTKTGITGSATRTQDWTLDALGNWTSLDTDGTTVNRTANAQNEYTSVGSATPTYDANGNMTTDETGRQFVFDAWNRTVTVKNSGGTTIAAYAHDGLGRRVSETKSGTTTDLYYSDQWQVLQENVAGVHAKRYVWSPVYVDALVLRDRDTNADGTLDERLWVQQDANWNVTALVNGSGVVVERLVYDPFGTASVLAANWSALGSSAYGWVYLHQGGRYDDVSGLYSFRNRDYSPTLGRWGKLDPLGFAAGDVNLYRAYGNGPTNAVDPSGLWTIPAMAQPIPKLSWSEVLSYQAELSWGQLEYYLTMAEQAAKKNDHKTVVVCSAKDPREDMTWLASEAQKLWPTAPVFSSQAGFTAKSFADRLVTDGYRPESIGLLIITAHGSNVAQLMNGKMNNDLDRIKNLLAPGAVISIQACNCGSAAFPKELANRLNATVITTGDSAAGYGWNQTTLWDRTFFGAWEFGSTGVDRLEQHVVATWKVHHPKK